MNKRTLWFDLWALVCRPSNCVVAGTTSASHTFCVKANAASYEEAVLEFFVCLWAFGWVCLQTSSVLHIHNMRVWQLVWLLGTCLYAFELCARRHRAGLTYILILCHKVRYLCRSRISIWICARVAQMWIRARVARARILGGFAQKNNSVSELHKHMQMLCSCKAYESLQDLHGYEYLSELHQQNPKHICARVAQTCEYVAALQKYDKCQINVYVAL